MESGRVCTALSLITTRKKCALLTQISKYCLARKTNHGFSRTLRWWVDVVLSALAQEEGTQGPSQLPGLQDILQRIVLEHFLK